MSRALQVLLDHNPYYNGSAVLLSHEGSVADVGNSDGNSRSDNFMDELTTSGSESTKRAKVATAASAAGMNFDFSSSTIGKDCIRTIEGLSYYTMGSA
jgi:hypothetical protein